MITWDEEFSHRYDEWSASMRADIDFYIDLARTPQTGRSSNSASNLEVLDEHDSSALWAYGLMVSPVTLGTMEFGSKVDEAEAGKLFAQALDAGSTCSIRPTCTRAAEARRSWDG